MRTRTWQQQDCRYPRTDGVYVSDKVHESSSFFQKKYARDYIQFFSDLDVYMAEQLTTTSESLHLPLAELKDRKNGKRTLTRYTLDNGRFRIVHPNGAVNYAYRDGEVLVFEGLNGSLRMYSSFYEFTLPVFQ